MKLRIPCSFVAGLTGRNRFKDKWQTIAALLVKYYPDVLPLYLTQAEIRRIQSKHFYLFKQKSALVKSCLEGKPTYVPVRYRNQVHGILTEKNYDFENQHQFISKDFGNFSLYGQIDGQRGEQVVEVKARMRYFYIGEHDRVQLGTYMLIKGLDGVLLQDLKGKKKETFFPLAKTKRHMAPILSELERVAKQIHKIFEGGLEGTDRTLLRFTLKNV